MYPTDVDPREFNDPPDIQRAGARYAGWHCIRCRGEVRASDQIRVNEDGDLHGEDWIDLTTVQHVACPED